MKHFLLALVVVTAAGVVTPAGSQPSAPPQADIVSDRLEKIERALRESRAQDNSLQQQANELARETNELRAQLIRAARTTQEYEAALADLQAQLVALDQEERGMAEALAGRRQRLTDLLGALERLARLPPEAMIALPGAPQDTLRSATLLRAAVPQLELQAKALRRDIESLAVVRDDIIAKRADQQAKAKALGAERARLGGLLSRKAALENQTLAERQKAAETATALAGEATDLRELLAGIAAERKAREIAARKAEAEKALARVKNRPSGEAAVAARGGASVPRDTPLAEPPAADAPQMASLGAPALGTFSQARGHLAFPAQGRMVQAFGERLSTGGEARGMTLETQLGAQIVAPYDGQVVFAGPFRDYGQLLIIEHAEGYHMLLAGFERIDSAVSQTLLAGEPVGVMPTAGHPRLYFELRQSGRPINPLPWLATPISKVSG